MEQKKRSKKFLVGKMQRNHGHEITQHEVAMAIRRFQETGGLIKSLPPQEDRRRQLIGTQHGSAYETVIEH